MEWLTAFAKGLALLNDYDHGQLDSKGLTLTLRNAIFRERNECQKIIDAMKANFDSDVFGGEKDTSFLSAGAQIGKGFGDQNFYPSIQEKVATLLYPIIKNHGLIDGDKRIAAACFLLLPGRNNQLFTKEQIPLIHSRTLASRMLFITSSKQEEIETVKKWVIGVLNHKQ